MSQDERRIVFHFVRREREVRISQNDERGTGRAGGQIDERSADTATGGWNDELYVALTTEGARDKVLYEHPPSTDRYEKPTEAERAQVRDCPVNDWSSADRNHR